MATIAAPNLNILRGIAHPLRNLKNGVPPAHFRIQSSIARAE
jgi:hypothetical protein